MAEVRDAPEWLSVGTTCRPAAPRTLAAAAGALRSLQALVPGRITRQRWVRYRIDLAHTAPPPPDVRLARLTPEIVAQLRCHPDAAQNQLRSGLRFWDLGLTGAFIWTGEEGPLCMQWLLTPEDNPRLKALAEWAGMYPPLARGCGRVENLFAFSNVRRKGVATLFEYALYEEARRSGLTSLLTHIHESNVSARRWADKTGWQEIGTITRYQLDVPGLRGRSVCLHRGAASDGAVLHGELGSVARATA